MDRHACEGEPDPQYTRFVQTQQQVEARGALAGLLRNGDVVHTLDLAHACLPQDHLHRSAHIREAVDGNDACTPDGQSESATRTMMGQYTKACTDDVMPMCSWFQTMKIEWHILVQ